VEHIEIHPETPQKRILSQIANCLLNDGLIICPTGSGYSLACHAASTKAVKSLYTIRKPKDPHKMTMVFKDMSSLSEYAVINNATFKYMNPLIPGPYTFILPATHYTQKKLHVKRKELGVHFPYTLFVKSLFEIYEGPLLIKSLFSDSEDSTFLPEKIDPAVSSRVDIIADMGPVSINPTTIINITNGTPQLVRMGAGEIAL